MWELSDVIIEMFGGRRGRKILESELTRDLRLVLIMDLDLDLGPGALS